MRQSDATKTMILMPLFDSTLRLRVACARKLPELQKDEHSKQRKQTLAGLSNPK
jgi:hypothetical protein